MANMSPTTQAVNTIAQCLANAAEAARGLNLSASQDLRSLLHIAACEAERVRKAIRKPAAKKPLAKVAKQVRAKGAGVAQVQMSVQPKSRRKSATVNGAAH
jgi:hypothetical protein